MTPFYSGLELDPPIERGALRALPTEYSVILTNIIVIIHFMVLRLGTANFEKFVFALACVFCPAFPLRISGVSHLILDLYFRLVYCRSLFDRHPDSGRVAPRLIAHHLPPSVCGFPWLSFDGNSNDRGRRAFVHLMEESLPPGSGSHSVLAKLSI